VDSYDVIIIGSGVGGATLAHRLAPSGKRILLLEPAVSPALTAMANALRVGDHLLERMGAAGAVQGVAGAAQGTAG
jgi:2-polyprenyl-6-methoxyphenol hydroxylase-like FAD-dependent oxidoreductase